MVNWDFGVPHFAAKIECDCLGCRSERQLESKTGEETATGPRLPPLPPLAENAILEPGEIVERDKPVLTMFAGSYLAPLLPMTRSTTWEIRRGAITSLARLSDDHLRAAVAALRSFKGRSVLVDIMEYCSSQLVDAVARRSLPKSMSLVSPDGEWSSCSVSPCTYVPIRGSRRILSSSTTSLPIKSCRTSR